MPPCAGFIVAIESRFSQPKSKRFTYVAMAQQHGDVA
jgi:hypothetical protein